MSEPAFSSVDEVVDKKVTQRPLHGSDLDIKKVTICHFFISVSDISVGANTQCDIMPYERYSSMNRVPEHDLLLHRTKCKPMHFEYG